MRPLTKFHQHRLVTMLVEFRDNNGGSETISQVMSGLQAGQPCTRTVFLWRYVFLAFAQRGLTLSVIPAVSSNTPEVHGLWKTVAIHLRQAQAQRCWQTLWMLVIYGFHFGQVLTCIFADSVTSCGFCRVMCVLKTAVTIPCISSSRNIVHLRLYGRANCAWNADISESFSRYFNWYFVVCMVSVFSAVMSWETR